MTKYATVDVEPLKELFERPIPAWGGAQTRFLRVQGLQLLDYEASVEIDVTADAQKRYAPIADTESLDIRAGHDRGLKLFIWQSGQLML